jgi:hypothetical protein
MRPQASDRRRPRIGLAGRAAGWLVAFSVLVQCAVSAGAALDMWIDGQGAGGMAQAACPEHSKPDHRSGQAGHDHEHCLLCNTAVGDCPTPVLPALSLARAGAAAPIVASDRIVYRKLVYANTARGPPSLA